MKPKVLIIFPRYSPKDGSHYPYWFEIFKASQNALDLKILYEASQTITLKPFNLAERFLKIIHARSRGYKNVYIHYSYAAVVLSKIVDLFIPMKIYYWNCEKYQRKPRGLLSWILPLANVLVTGSESLAKQYRKIFNLKHTRQAVVSNWVMENHGKKQKLQKGKTHILFVHHISPRKGSKELPIIIKETLKLVQNAHFHIIGDGPDLSWLKTQLSNVKSNVTFYGSLPLKKTAEFFNACDYFIMPSRAEGFPHVILEAMVAKIPFVSTTVGNVSEIVSKEQKRYLVPPKRPKEFARSLIKLIKSKTTKEMVVSNYKLTKNYTLNTATKEFIGLFDRKTTKAQNSNTSYYLRIYRHFLSFISHTKESKHIPNHGRSNRSTLIDICRLISIGLVTFAHIFQSVGNKTYGGFFGIKDFYWVSWGGVGVTLFLIISGISLELSGGQKQQSWLEFAKNRIKKIYPTYWACLLVSIPVYLANMYYNYGTFFPVGHYSPQSLICSVTGLCAFIGEWGGPFISTAWFISLIMSLYVFYPSLSGSIKKHPWFTLLFTVWLSVQTRISVGPFDHMFNRPTDWFPTARLAEFTLGIFLAHHLPKKIWTSVVLSKKVSTLIHSGAIASFPFFLIHHPLLFIIPHLIKSGAPFILATAVYLAVSIGASKAIVLIQKI